MDAAILFAASEEVAEVPDIMLVDDERIVLDGGIPVIEKAIPGANVIGFTKPSQALEFCRKRPVAIAFLDIDLGRTSGLDLCRDLLKINPRTNIVYLTAYSDYSLDAWSTGASGFMLKPITPDGVREQLKNLRYPFLLGGEGV